VVAPDFSAFVMLYGQLTMTFVDANVLYRPLNCILFRRKRPAVKPEPF
jgi:hypothetical protein